MNGRAILRLATGSHESMSFQTWYSSSGITRNSAAQNVAFIGVRNGDATCFVIMLEPSGIAAIRGSDTIWKRGPRTGRARDAAAASFRLERSRQLRRALERAARRPRYRVDR
jgi:hypothetical protein